MKLLEIREAFAEILQAESTNVRNTARSVFLEGTKPHNYAQRHPQRVQRDAAEKQQEQPVAGRKCPPYCPKTEIHEWKHSVCHTVTSLVVFRLRGQEQSSLKVSYAIATVAPASPVSRKCLINAVTGQVEFIPKSVCPVATCQELAAALVAQNVRKSW
jgi:hypothetical protein